MVRSTLGSLLQHGRESLVPVHGPGDVVRDEGARVLDRLVQQQLLVIHRPVLEAVLGSIVCTYS